MADAAQAYTQVDLKGTEAWVELPEMVPPAWRHIERLARRLLGALDGHPDSGGYRERHWEAASRVSVARV